MERASTWCLGGHGFDSCQGHSCCLLRGLLSMDNCELLEIFLSKLQYHSNVSYHFSSRFSRDAYRFSRDESCSSRESLKYLDWNILYMYYSQNIKKVKMVSFHTDNFNRLVTRLHVYGSITYSDLNQQKIGSRYNCKVNSTGNTAK